MIPVIRSYNGQIKSIHTDVMERTKMLNIELHRIEGEVLNLSFGETDVLYDLVLCAELIKHKDRYYVKHSTGHFGSRYEEVDYLCDIGDKE